MPTPDERVAEAHRAAHYAIVEAIGETRFAVGLACRLRMHAEATPEEEYVVTVLAMLYEVRDVIEQALPVVPAAEQEEQQDG